VDQLQVNEAIEYKFKAAFEPVPQPFIVVLHEQECMMSVIVVEVTLPMVLSCC